MIIRAKTFLRWLKANFSKDQLSDMANHGANIGWHGLSYYTDTTLLYEKYKDELWNLMIEEGEGIGHKNPFEFIASFRQAAISGAEQMECLLVHAAAEIYAYKLAEA